MFSRLGFSVALSVLCLSGITRKCLSGEATAKPQSGDERSHWAFRPVRGPVAPPVRDARWLHNPIDAFVLARLENAGIKPAAPAERRTLLRRVYLDLIGLPPTPREQQAFLQDHSPNAYARVVDDLLSRPQYGERWARHWLDVVRYAESNGYERDGTKQFAWRYRDYVIDALNKDKPYDRFLTEQIAGDELDGADAETQIATTFLRLGTWDDEPADPLVDRYDQLDDVLGTTATAFLGLTLRCARCHDHKFEPFPQTDYYKMLAVFEPLKRPQKEREELERFVGTEAEVSAYEAQAAKTSAAVAALQKKLEELKAKIRDRVFASARDTKAGSKHTMLPSEAIAAFQQRPDRRSTAQRALVKKFAAKLEVEIQEATSPPEKAQRAQWEMEIFRLSVTTAIDPHRAYIWYEDTPKAPATHLFRRGNPAKPGKVMEPAIPVVLVQKQPTPPQPTRKSTGRRLWLARWMTSPENPLVARVMVNRLWQHHFGQGLVASENDFGVMGQPPTHPELLDWLASEFVARKWSMKALHRMMVLSNTYQMSCTNDRTAAKIDPENRLLWRQRQRRLEAETVRDAVLAVSGQLNSEMSGPSVYPRLPQAVLDGQSRPGDGWGKSDERQSARRSIYIFIKRSLAVPELDLLDTPDTTSSCEHRPVSTTGPQALTFLNGEFIHQQAYRFAERLRREAGNEPATQVQDAFALALCRPARPMELQQALEFLVEQKKQVKSDARRGAQTDASLQALEAFCLVLLNTNEFAYLQ
ncbi:MAG TPA: DUF1549 and DUF1553 domain-containing protein [Gemmataceae bacterium]|nr:DUF1549 and DUF1553 domain-containing protein [Gemmataceae bacterium]